MAEPPYRVGDPAGTVTITDDVARVHSDRVQTFTRVGPGWHMTVASGHEYDVGDSGFGVLAEKGVTGCVVPMTDELRRELATKGEGFTVRETTQDHELELRPPPPPKEMEPRGVEGRDGIR